MPNYRSKYQRGIKGKRWDRLRRKVLDNGNWRCVHCGRWGNHVDHILAMEHGGAMWAESNLQVLCPGCHWAKTKIERGIVPDPERDAWQAELARLVG